ncbi:MAG TPA: OsmC family protein [Candidatus Baltobacteraceae bacterium]|jgi:organic hydroperoxide reductase OsmC/OhrA|nr:OsmC family protein [Candidatus Baltobacteraceae bacterium]
MHPEHRYTVTTTWTGNLGSGTSSYRSYGRDHEMTASGKARAIAGSSASVFRGDESRYNPEELLVGALSACHMLMFLHLCADARIVVQAYRDEAAGTMRVHPDGAGEFTQVVLRPQVTFEQPADAAQALPLHERAHHLCFIARSVNFPVRCDPAS